jgi:hypothetical protein
MKNQPNVMSGRQKTSTCHASNQTKTKRKCKQNLFGIARTSAEKRAVLSALLNFQRKLFVAESTTNQGRKSNQTGAQQEQDAGLRSR